MRQVWSLKLDVNTHKVQELEPWLEVQDHSPFFELFLAYTKFRLPMPKEEKPVTKNHAVHFQGGEKSTKDILPKELEKT